MKPVFALAKLRTLLLFASLGAASCLGAAELRNAELTADASGAELNLQLDETAAVKVFTLQNPQRVVVDLPQTRASAGFSLPPSQGIVTRLRQGQPQPGTLRLVLETQAGFEPKIEKQGSSIRVRLGQMQATTLATAPKTTSSPAAIEQPKQASVMPPPPQNPLLVGGKQNNPASQSSQSSPAATDAPAVIEAPKTSQVAVAPPRNATKTVQSVLGSQSRKLVVAIDAGHGGKDPGAIGPKGTREKKITLAVAKELARQINEEPGMRAVLIRDGDEFVPLQERFMRARRAQADIFLSIHADAAENHTVHGSSVFVLSTKGASSQAARWLADKENAADLVGGVSLDDKDRGLSAVLLDLSQSATMRVSEDAAQEVLSSLKALGKAHKKQVEHANFVVLRSPDVPSMLIETGFITNPAEEEKLNDPNHRSRLASAIVGGVRNYFSDQPPPGTWFAQQARPVRERQHVVARGETLSSIAAQHEVPVQAILQANQKRDDQVRIGERLTIPAIAATAGLPE